MSGGGSTSMDFIEPLEAPPADILGWIRRANIFRVLGEHMAFHAGAGLPEAMQSAPLFVVEDEALKVVHEAAWTLTQIAGEDCFPEGSGFAYFGGLLELGQCDEGHPLILVGCWWWRWETDTGINVGFLPLRGHMGILPDAKPLHVKWDLILGTPWNILPRADADGGRCIAIDGEQYALNDTTDVSDEVLIMASLHLFMSSHVALREHPRLSRQIRRAWERAHSPDLNASIITLRRPDSTESDGHDGARQYHVRWVVRPHIRMQPVGVGRSERRPTFVHAYVKGPTGAPLKTARPVYRVAR